MNLFYHLAGMLCHPACAHLEAAASPDPWYSCGIPSQTAGADTCTNSTDRNSRMSSRTSLRDKQLRYANRRSSFLFPPFKSGHKMVDVEGVWTPAITLPGSARFQQTIILVGLDPGLKYPQATHSVERNQRAWQEDHSKEGNSLKSEVESYLHCRM